MKNKNNKELINMFNDMYCINNQKLVSEQFEKVKKNILKDYNDISNMVNDLVLEYQYGDIDEYEKEEIFQNILDIDRITEKMEIIMNEILIKNKN